MAENRISNPQIYDSDEEDDEIETQAQDWDDWGSDDDEESDFLCLFCTTKFNSIESLFQHCTSTHFFDFSSFRKKFGLDFYDSFKLINYIRSQVAANRCWSCGVVCQSNEDLLKHLHEPDSYKKDEGLHWNDDKYLKPFLQDDSLLHSFGEDDDVQEDSMTSFDKEELMRELKISEHLESICLDDENMVNRVESVSGPISKNMSMDTFSPSSGSVNVSTAAESIRGNGTMANEEIELTNPKQKDKNLKISFANAIAREKKSVNDNYFGAYSSFGIHREMINDKVRMDAYRGAILNNPSLIKCATVMDVGCGTGILSLFAAQAGASKVIAIEASEKMAAVATQIATDNGLLLRPSESTGENTGVIEVVQGMVEEVDKRINIPPQSVDVLVSEWMGYCLLYETMLDSVLYARDRWLKPGGAMLPDTATIFVAGFGKGGTSIPFWEDVYGFNMSCIGKEVVEDSAQLPIVDVVDSRDLMTNAVLLQNFDLMTVKPNELDFTTSFELELKPDFIKNAESGPTWCHGVVLWFETGFTNRFCKEMPTILSTSPYTPKTHWSQTILTFREPIALGLEKWRPDGAVVIGSDSSPAAFIQSRISIVRGAEHRSIDLSLEISAVRSDGRKRSFPVQVFNL
ncbi:type I protein arginine methyltransferase [Ranunculus cassubicifolius]